MQEIYEKVQCMIIEKQIKNDVHINFKGNILIVSDRLKNLSLSLSEYIKNVTDGNVLGIVSDYKAMSELSSNENEVDYIIIAGYLHDEEIYNILNGIWKNKNNVKIVFWALIDSLILDICSKHEIIYKFDRRKDIKEFIEYLMKIGNI